MNRALIALIALNIMATLQMRPQTAEAFKTVALDAGWQFRRDTAGWQWRDASVPGTVHADLLRHGLIDDPFVGLNEYGNRWVEEADWTYATTFDITAGELRDYSNVALVMDGLDTFAEVSVNGTEVARTRNMFLRHEREVRHLLHEGSNEVTVRFTSATRAVLGDYERQGINYPADNDKDSRHLSVYARKAPYHYGWDWGLRLVTCGVWRGIGLHFYNGCKIDDVHSTTTLTVGGAAVVGNEVRIANNGTQAVDATVAVSCTFGGKPVTMASTSLRLTPGDNVASIPLTIDTPRLWMPNGWGEPALYDIEATVTDNGGRVMARHRHQVGIREVEFVSEPDSIGRSFYFRVNGQPIFAKGVNYIPQDITLTNVGRDDYERLFQNLAAANINMVRVWGGGIYEDDYFYELADRNGIMVWQDFMFGCSTYPATPDFLDNVREEADDNIRRLRNHPCLVLWCGNNEIAEGIKYWGWSRRYDDATYAKMRRDYDRLFKGLLPGRVAELDGGRSYIHTSPDTANWGRPATFPLGDSHYWGLWYGKELFEVMDTLDLRFVSEYGIQSFPEMKTIRTFATDGDLDINSEVMRNRQKSSTGNETIMHYITSYYDTPRDFDDFVYLSQLVQGHGMAHCIVANRRNRPVCMGSLYWQLNDCWPAISWSAIDYYGNKKALYYHSRDAFAPVIVSAVEDGERLDIYTISDKLEAVAGCTIELAVEDFHGNTLSRHDIECDIAPNTTARVSTLVMADIVTEWMKAKTLLDIRVVKDGTTLFAGKHYFLKPRDLDLPRPTVAHSVRWDGDKAIITLTTDCLAKDVFIETPAQGIDYTDNYFDLQAGETKTVVLSGNDLTDDVVKGIKIRTLTDTY